MGNAPVFVRKIFSVMERIKGLIISDKTTTNLVVTGIKSQPVVE